MARESRRRFLRKAAIAAVAVPTITTIVTAQPAAASSHEKTCSPACQNGQTCNTATGTCECSSNDQCGAQTCSNKQCVDCTTDASCEDSTKYCYRSGAVNCTPGFCTTKRLATETCTRSGQCITGCCAKDNSAGSKGTCIVGAGNLCVGG